MGLSRGDVVAGAFEVERSLEADDTLEVCRGRHLMTGKHVTLKVLRVGVPWCDAAIERAQGIEEVLDDGLARCLHQGPAGRGRWFFAFEGVRSDDPDTKVPRRATPATTARLGMRVAGALAALHEHGFAHGHVRPDRISLARDGEGKAKLLDFVLPSERAWVTAAARYAAPEIVTGAAASAEGDIFALGVILWELLAGRALVATESRVGVLLHTLFDAPDPPFCDDPALASWVTRMFAAESIERPEANQVEAALRAYAEGTAIPTLEAPTPREALDGRKGASASIFVVRPPPGKTPEAIGLGDDWRRDVEGHGAQLSTLPEGAIVGLVRGRTAHAVTTSAVLIAKATQEHAFRASLVAGLLREGSRDEERARARDELAAVASIVSLTPAGVTRLSSRLAEHASPSVALRPSGDAYILVSAPQPSRPRRGGTLEIETGAAKGGPSGRRRKTGEIDLGAPAENPRRRKTGEIDLGAPAENPRRRRTGEIDVGAPAENPRRRKTGEIDVGPPRGRGGTLVIEPEPRARATETATPRRAAGGTERGLALSAQHKMRGDGASERVDGRRETPERAEAPRRGRTGTLVIEPEPPKTGAAARVLDVHAEETRVGTIPAATHAAFHHEDTPTLEIEVSDELVELSRATDGKPRVDAAEEP
jgi:hypothetical protein